MVNPTLLLIGHGSRDSEGVAQFKAFSDELAHYLEAPVVPAFLELADPPIAAAIEQVVVAGTRQIVALPLFLGPAGHQKNDVPTTINWARQRWPDVSFAYGIPLGVHPFIVDVLAERAREALLQLDTSVPREQTAILLLGRGSRDPDSNSNVAKLARLLWEGRDFGWVEPAFYSLTTPDLEEGARRCVALGAERVIVVPHFLFHGVILTRTAERVEEMRTKLGMDVVLAAPLGCHIQLFELVRQRMEEAISGEAHMNCDMCKYRHPIVGFEDEVGRQQTSNHSHGLRGILPDFDTTRAAPMGAAPLRYNEAGEPDWEGTWQSFCELALHGGPPHRGTLLEPVSAESALADPARYNDVVEEIERGLRSVTKLKTVKSAVAGWVGLECHSEAMALWLLQAILVENVFARREDATLFFPAAPHFTVEGEIKNIVTCAAKSVHYWQEHIARDEKDPAIIPLREIRKGD